MISWRYHLISIVAVFLALGLGLLAGTSALKQGLVHSLQNQTEQLRRDLDDLRSRVATMTQFEGEVLPLLVGSRLTGQQVVIVTQRGTDGDALASARAAVDLAGAEVLTTLTIQPEMAAASPASHRSLTGLLGLSEFAKNDVIVGAAAEALARRLATEPHVAQGGKADVLGAMLAEGFVTSSSPSLSDVTLHEIGGRGQLVITVGGGSATVDPPLDGFMVPLVQNLAGLGVTAGAGESTSTDGFVSAVRSQIDPETAPVVTVDDLELTPGEAALVIGLAQAAVDGTGGDYGVKAGASSLLPSP